MKIWFIIVNAFILLDEIEKNHVGKIIFIYVASFVLLIFIILLKLTRSLSHGNYKKYIFLFKLFLIKQCSATPDSTTHSYT